MNESQKNRKAESPNMKTNCHLAVKNKAGNVTPVSWSTPTYKPLFLNDETDARMYRNSNSRP